MDNKTVLVTGATGFLGSHLVRSLAAQGCSVIILKRSFSSVERIRDILPQAVVYDIDVTDPELPFKEHHIDHVIHCATNYGKKGERTLDIVRTNILFPLTLLQHSKQYGVLSFVTIDSYFSKFSDFHYLSDYTVSKKQFREWGNHIAETSSLKFFNLILEHLYGPYDSEIKFTEHVIQSCLKNDVRLPLTGGEQKRDFVYVDDVVSAVHAVISNYHIFADQSTDIEVGTGHSVPISDFIRRVKQRTGSLTKLGFGDLPYRTNEIMDSFADTRLLKKCGWAPSVSIDEGVDLIVKTYSSQK